MRKNYFRSKVKFLVRSFFFLERSVGLFFPVEMLSSFDDGRSSVRAPESDELVCDVLAFVELVQRIDEFASRFFSQSRAFQLLQDTFSLRQALKFRVLVTRIDV